MDDAPLLPTRIKYKLPHTLSFPVGAKRVSESLAGVPQFTELALEFYFPSDRALIHGWAAEYTVISADYYAPSEWALTQSPIWHRPWKVTVWAVPRTLRHEILAAINTEALPAIRAWLIGNFHSSGRDGGHSLTLTYDPLKEELSRREGASLDWRTEVAD